jgi:hypothetical protein
VEGSGVGTVAQVQMNSVVQVSIPIFDLVVPATADRGQGCLEREQDSFVWALVDSENPPNGELDYAPATPAKAFIDTTPPPLPASITASGSENAITITWKMPADRAADIAFYQALCATTVGMSPVRSDPPKARYQTGRQLCGTGDDITNTPTVIPGDQLPTDPDAGDGTIVLPDGLSQFQPAFICGENLSSTAQSLRIEGLQNGTQYTVELLAIDKAGNATSTFFTAPLVPHAVTDFWEDIHNQGSNAEGGFCLLSQTFGDDNPLTNTLRSFRDNTLADTAYGRWLIDVYYGTIGAIDLHGSLALRIVAGVLLLPLVLFALLWHLVTLPGLVALGALLVLIRRRKLTQLRLASAAATLAVVVLLPARAHAQTPYWEDNQFNQTESELPLGDPERVHWHAGVRLGPYIPAIDDQVNMPVGKFAGPYEQMFGGASVVPMIDVDYFPWRGFGQLGLGVSAGYMGKKAHAWLEDSDPMSPNRQRAPGDENTFRLVPLTLNAVYRFTYLDDNYGIPIVPYARGGLAYYVWWINAPSGDFARSCVGPNTSTSCPKTTAAGASLGVVGSIGLAIRAERIDASAARSMRESGIEHAGFFGELSMGKVDGFGSDKKLAVGDTTWFAGVEFEF